MVSRTLIVSAVALFAPFATAQDLNSAAERTAACLDIEDAAERLACFESAATALSDALEEVPAADGSLGAQSSASAAEPPWSTRPPTLRLPSPEGRGRCLGRRAGPPARRLVSAACSVIHDAGLVGASG